MEPFILSSVDTYQMVARQGYAAQGRRQSVFRLPALAENPQSPTDSDTTLNDNVPSTPPRCRKSTPEGPVKPINIPPPLLSSDADTGPGILIGSPEFGSSLLETFSQTSPSANSMLHERFSTELRSDTIEEKDGENGVVIHNGLRRLSMTEAGLVKHGRPRVVNI
ncbi:hypothetical protein COEREDRAFT_83516 [Coemansia reversa NRRL 1564]|uniref:Uncharacterized protein n=1 Tax=Coemansia reversa (strain ATCC 12441 / NRRL 1564) TaxID=763665 RepID=A0A2G5B307_COERN|nr:hypothetical protein COEREDRAFT_83516 [Coemansia reversa NRRL 1564]|eukprot:PIA13402.1 hypothetical protein COEREDRAFT_83516 [Coemansia reversa NRRL 1564]